MTDKTYAQLSAAGSLSDPDLLAVYQGSGPLKKVAASVLAAYIVSTLTSSYLVKANNLSDLASASTARTNLGLGTAAVQNVSAFFQVANNLSEVGSPSTARTNLGLGSSATVNTGTSGATIPLLNAANTWSAQQTFPGVSGNNASLLLTPSSGDPGTPVNGQVWVTTGGAVKARANGVTVTLGSSASNALLSGNNLSDLASASTARTNLGLGTSATHAATDFLAVSNNLSDLGSASTARTNLGLGSLATLSSVNNANWSGTALAIANGGTGSTTASAARTALGLGTSATHAATDFALVANDLSDLANPVTAAANLGVVNGYVTISGTTPTLVQGNGVTAVAYQSATGKFQVTFNAMPDLNFCALGIAINGSSHLISCVELARTTTTVTLQFNDGSGAINPAGFSFLAMRTG